MAKNVNSVNRSPRKIHRVALLRPQLGHQRGDYLPKGLRRGLRARAEAQREADFSHFQRPPLRIRPPRIRPRSLLSSSDGVELARYEE